VAFIELKIGERRENYAGSAIDQIAVTNEPMTIAVAQWDGRVALAKCWPLDGVGTESASLPAEKKTSGLGALIGDLFAAKPEFREDPSRIPTTRTAGRTDYAYSFTAPANHRLYVWIEWWKDGKRTIDQDCNTAYVAKRGDRLERSLQVVFNDGKVAGPATAGQVRIDWLFDDGKGNSTSGRWRPDFFEGLATSVDLNRVKSWKPKVGETVNLLDIRGGKESIDGNPVTEERLRAGRWEAVMILRARVEAVPESRMPVAPITSFNAWNDNEEPSPALLRLGEQFGATLEPFTDARNLREQIAYRIKKDAAERAKAEQMLQGGAPPSPDARPEDLVMALEKLR
jgi:hypothetical protein